MTRKKKKKNRGKQKGASFERKVCKELSLWISKGKNEDVFWRSAMSGGRSTVSLKGGKKLSAHAGDVSQTHKKGTKFSENFIVELKHYGDLDLHGIFNHKGKFLSFWQKVQADALTYGKEPILIAKQNYYPTLMVLSELGTKKLKIPVSYIFLIAPHYDMHVLHYTHFLKTNPKSLRDKKDGKRKRIRPRGIIKKRKLKRG